MLAAGFPLFARQMFNGLGIQWAGTLLGCFAVLMIPIPIAFWRYGAKLRQKSKYSPTMGDKPPHKDDESTDEEAELGGAGAERDANAQLAANTNSNSTTEPLGATDTEKKES